MTGDETTVLRNVVGETSPTALLTYPELAVWLNDNVRHLRRLVDEKQIPYVKVGRFVRFDPGEILKWLDANHHGRNNLRTRSRGTARGCRRR